MVKPLDKRISRRFPISVRVAFFHSGAWEYGFTTDLSRTGFFVNTEHPFEVGTLQIFSFPVVEAPHLRLAILGKVARVSSRERGARISGMGVRFVEAVSTVGFANLYRFVTQLCRAPVPQPLPEELVGVRTNTVFVYDFEAQEFTSIADSRLPERRVRPRALYHQPITYTVGAKNFHGEIRNLSPDGMFIQTMELLPMPDDKVFIELTVRGDERTVFKLIGRPAWSRPAIPALSLESGFGLHIETAAASGEYPSFRHFVRAVETHRK